MALTLGFSLPSKIIKNKNLAEGLAWGWTSSKSDQAETCITLLHWTLLSCCSWNPPTTLKPGPGPLAEGHTQAPPPQRAWQLTAEAGVSPGATAQLGPGQQSRPAEPNPTAGKSGFFFFVFFLKRLSIWAGS